MTTEKCPSWINLGGEGFGNTFSAATHIISCSLTSAHTVHRGSSKTFDNEGEEVTFDIYWTRPVPPAEAWGKSR